MTNDTLNDARAEESNLVAHARRELRIIGEDPETIEHYLRVVQAFADCGHSGSSAPVMIAGLVKLLRFEPLSPLTDDPDEWLNVCEHTVNGEDLWQSKRNSEAFSQDGGRTYYLLSEREAAGGSLETTPRHTSAPRAALAQGAS